MTHRSRTWGAVAQHQDLPEGHPSSVDGRNNWAPVNEPWENNKNESLSWNKWMCLIWDCKTCDESIWNLSFMFEIETKAFSWIRSLDLPCSIFHRCKHRYTATFENSDWNLEVQIPDCLMQDVLDTNFFGCKFCWIYAPNPRKIHLVSWLNIATFTCNWLSSEDSEHDPIHQNRFHHLSPRFF